MQQYRDIHEYHEPCYYCLCDKCNNENCRWVKCEFCEGGKNGCLEKCNKKDIK